MPPSPCPPTAATDRNQPLSRALLISLLLAVSCVPQTYRPDTSLRGIVHQASFEGGSKSTHWPGDFDLVDSSSAGGRGRSARAVPRRERPGVFVSLPIQPPRPVGSQTVLRFRYHLTGADTLIVQIFDATVQDNRHVLLEGIRQGRWTPMEIDFSRDSHRNDGTNPSEFTKGNLVDDIFFFVEGPGAANAVLHIDDVVLFDAEVTQ